MKLIKKILIIILIIILLILLDFLSIFMFKVKEEVKTIYRIPPTTYYIKKGKIIGLYYVKTYHSNDYMSPEGINKGYYSYEVWIKAWYKYRVKEN